MTKIFVSLLIVAACCSTNVKASDCVPTLRSYNELKMGASYKDAVAAFGCEGDEMSHSEMPNLPITQMYTWSKDGSVFPMITTWFADNKLITKGQLGLRK